jgi:hypothetical protein
MAFAIRTNGIWSSSRPIALAFSATELLLG